MKLMTYSVSFFKKFIEEKKTEYVMDFKYFFIKMVAATQI